MVLASLYMLFGNNFAALQGKRMHTSYMGAMVFNVLMTLFLAPLVVKLLEARIPYPFLHMAPVVGLISFALGLAIGPFTRAMWYRLATNDLVSRWFWPRTRRMPTGIFSR